MQQTSTSTTACPHCGRPMTTVIRGDGTQAAYCPNPECVNARRDTRSM